MDFVVVGLGLGALGVLLGVALLGWLAGQAERRAAVAPTPATATYERAAAAECRGAGQAFLYAGAAVILATVGGLAGALDDQIGAVLVATTATVGALGILLWGYLHHSRHPMPPRPRRQLATAPAPEAALMAPATQPALLVQPAEDAVAAPTAETAPERAEPPAEGGAATATPSANDAPIQPTPEAEHVAEPRTTSNSESQRATEPAPAVADAMDEDTSADDDPAVPAPESAQPRPRTMANSRS